MSVSERLTVFLAAGEMSGDALGAGLMAALRRKTGGRVDFVGVGGPAMVAAGLDTLFPASDIAVIGPRAVIGRLPLIFRRLREATEAVGWTRPDVLVVVDSPEFTQRLAKRARRLRPDLPIVKYVAPQIWAWRPHRAPRMRATIDHVMAVLPFEPAVYAERNGPPTTYVGHPLGETVTDYRPSAQEAARRDGSPPLVLVLPGSRVSEVSRLIDIFGKAVALLADAVGPVEPVIPAVPHLMDLIRRRTASWAVPPRIVAGDAAKLAAMREARVALAASGTVTLELALAEVPTVVAYRLEHWVAPLVALMLQVDTVVLANLVVGRKVMPELLQYAGTPKALAAALAAALRDGPERQAQLEGLAEAARRLALPSGTASDAAAETVLRTYETKTGRQAPRP